MLLTGYEEKLPFVKPAPIEVEELAKQRKQKDRQKKVSKDSTAGAKLDEDVDNLKANNAED